MKAEQKRDLAPGPMQLRLLWATVSLLCVFTLVFGIVFALRALSQVAVYFGHILVPLALAWLLSYMLDPMVERLSETRFSRNAALAMVFLLFVLLLLFAITILVPVLLREIVSLLGAIPRYIEQISDQLSRLGAEEGATAIEGWGAWMTGWLSPMSVEEKGAFLAGMKEQLPQMAQQVLQWFVNHYSTLAGVLKTLFGVIIVPVFAFFFLRDRDFLREQWKACIPLPEGAIRDEAIYLIEQINRIMAGFFRGQILIAFIVGVLTAIGFLVVGVPYAILLGVITAVFNIIPFFGLIVSIVPALIVTFVHYGDWQHVLLVLAVFSSVQVLDNILISPTIMGDKTGLHPVVVVVGLMFWGRLMGGMFGVLMAVPLTALVKVLLERYVWRKSPIGLVPDPSD
jgi:predicted PurR-regulated permease PerM